MNTFNVLQALFVADLRELHRLRKQKWFVLPMSLTVKEEHLGRCCYLAEEFLDSTDLCTLKQEVELDEHQWRSYKAKISAQ